MCATVIKISRNYNITTSSSLSLSRVTTWSTRRKGEQDEHGTQEEQEERKEKEEQEKQGEQGEQKQQEG